MCAPQRPPPRAAPPLSMAASSRHPRSNFDRLENCVANLIASGKLGVVPGFDAPPSNHLTKKFSRRRAKPSGNDLYRIADADAAEGVPRRYLTPAMLFEIGERSAQTRGGFIPNDNQVGRKDVLHRALKRPVAAAGRRGRRGNSEDC